MRLPQLCFIVAAVSAVSAVTHVAATNYPNSTCFGTPVPPCSGQCGCPIPNTPGDVCQGNVPAPGQLAITYYYCTSGQMTCTDDGFSYGCQGHVWNCECWTCNSEGGGCQCDPSSVCTKTDKVGFCGAYYGCSSF